LQPIDFIMISKSVYLAHKENNTEVMQCFCSTVAADYCPMF